MGTTDDGETGYLDARLYHAGRRPEKKKIQTLRNRRETAVDKTSSGEPREGTVPFLARRGRRERRSAKGDQGTVA